MRESNQQAYVLINRPYSETSWISEVFTREHGRLGLMAKGARRQKSKLKGALMPFQPVRLDWVGKGEIPTLVSAEINLSEYSLLDHELTGDALVCGFYCNELIVNLLHRHDPHSVLFDRYHDTLIALAKSEQPLLLPAILREFEISVMRETGYAVDFHNEADGVSEIERDGFYRYQTGQGFIRVASQVRGSFSGRVIRSLDTSIIKAPTRTNDEHSSHQDGVILSAYELSQAKQLMRDILRNSLGRRAIISRELFYPKPR